MDNQTALKSLCNAIASSFYPDDSTIKLALFNEGIDAAQDAQPKDVAILKIAVSLVVGYIESSRNENGISISVREGAVKDSISYWCAVYGVNAEDVLSDSLRIIEDGSNLW